MLFLTFLGIGAPASAAPSTNADLAGIGLLQGALSSSFSAGTLNYTVSLPNSTPSDRVQPFAADTNATITVNGIPVTHGTMSGAISIPVGTSTVTIVVTAEDTTVWKTYTIVYTRAAPVNADLGGLVLSSGSLSPSFSPSTASYTATVAHIVDEIAVTPTVADATSVRR